MQVPVQRIQLWAHKPFSGLQYNTHIDYKADSCVDIGQMSRTYSLESRRQNKNNLDRHFGNEEPEDEISLTTCGLVDPPFSENEVKLTAFKFGKRISSGPEGIDNTGVKALYKLLIKNARPRPLTAYTDGSSDLTLSNGGAGINIILQDGTNKIKEGAGQISSNFTCELTAIWKALDVCLNQPSLHQAEGILIYSDSISALEAIQKGNTKITQKLEPLENNCILHWIPADAGIGAMAAALQKFDRDPEQQLYTLKIVDIAADVMEMHDDIVLLGESKINLQKKINVLRKYFEDNFSTLNQSKSKVMVFRNGGRKARSDVWFWGQLPLTITSKYTYMCHQLTASNSTQQAAKHFKNKALNAINAVWAISTKTRINSIRSSLKLLDSMGLSTLLYAAPI
ncbi:hypothetical protein LAZ67_21001641 [Cordylochernes scorpioides]|uniref:RNase H type-1 domain-containing protein n=1 Tax=Cordylochernes scorpioides TaxID=51811 RepID=A0ABY6LPJ8_9ARAC|nr:hypothetical protein LAZ67_21001641 [Cordylochernes scorpioides]